MISFCLKQEAEKYDERTRNLISAADDARKAFEEVDRQLRDIDRDIKKIKDEMEKDFGKFRVIAYTVFSGYLRYI